ncbi:MAG: hypothetical protein UU25_C0015G0009 [Microgenomates group bacterium GW2011_GWB1_40_9]|nr:MAG: hypothetical protein UU25_C0015G0009 [Microgenomates group bacterium GW2011_GWB1_40_9]
MHFVRIILTQLDGNRRFLVYNSLMKSITTWDYSLDSETRRLLHTAHLIAIGFYRVNQFLVLPYSYKAHDASIVTFPDLPYLTIHNFWKEVQHITVGQFPLHIKESLLQSTKTLVENAHIQKPQSDTIQKIWQRAEPAILDGIYSLVPNKKGTIQKIIIHPTSFGSTCSFNIITHNINYIELYLQEGLGVATITEALISSLTREDVFEKLGGLWQESELLADWLVTQSSLAQIVKHYDNTNTFSPTIKGIRNKEQPQLTLDSEQFYKKLGIPTGTPPFSLTSDTPTLYAHPIQNLTDTETRILNLFIQKALVLSKRSSYACKHVCYFYCYHMLFRHPQFLIYCSNFNR